MNKVTRLFGSAALVTGLVVGGSATAASAATSARNTDHSASYSRTSDDNGNDHRRNDRDHRFLLICFDHHGNHWFEWGDRYGHDSNCFIIRIY